MKSSAAVFTKKNPFPPEPRRTKSHYSPTRAKKLPKQQKKLVLSPVRFTPSNSPPDSPSPPLSPEDQHCLKGLHNVHPCPPSLLGKHNFSESWPSTDRSSSPVSTDAHPHAVTSRTQEPSVLEKYIDRFRYGRPKSREERQKVAADGADDQPFWWMSSNPSSSTPTRTKECCGESLDCRNGGPGSTENLCRHQEETSLSLSRGRLDLSALALSDSSHCEQAEPEILQLQERARKLLQRSEHSLSSGSSSVPVSSEGLGCSDFSDPISVDEPIRKPTIPSLIDTVNLMTPCGLLPAATASGPVGSRPKPEDDILFQWRLRRKMEQAREWSHMSSYGSAFHQPLPSRLALQTQPGFSLTPAPLDVTENVSTPACCPVHEPVPPSFHPVQPSSGIHTKSESILRNHINSVSPYDRMMGSKQPQIAHALSPVPEPVASSSNPVQPSSSIHTKSESILRNHMTSVLPYDRIIDSKQPETAHALSRSREQVCSSESSEEWCSKQQYSSSLSPQPAESTKEPGSQRRSNSQQINSRVEQEQGKKRTVPRTQKKKSDRYVKDIDMIERNQHTVKAKDRPTRGQEKVRSKNKENTGDRESQSSTRSLRPRDSPSPIHNTLGQVVSEVLFPDADTTSNSPTTPSYTVPQTPCSSAPSPQHSSQPSEVIGRLMQEAQDSDGLEFEDDPLLIVLRQQRKRVKEQLCNVDLMLENFTKNEA